MSMASEMGGSMERSLEPKTATGRKRGPVAAARARRQRDERVVEVPGPRRPAVAVLCACSPDGPVAECAAREAAALAQEGFDVWYYGRRAPGMPMPGVVVRGLEADGATDPIKTARGFAASAQARMHDDLAARGDVSLLVHEWQAIPAMVGWLGKHAARCVLSLHSLETQRSDMSSPASLAIERVEREGLMAAHAVVVRSGETASHVEQLAPMAGKLLHHARTPFPVQEYESHLDPGAVKARYAIGPTDPTVLYIGDMNHAHGPDLLIKAVPPVLRNHSQVRVVYVGDGDLLWPVRVQARYLLLLDHAVRILGHLGGAKLQELIAASDMVVVPSRSRTEDWEILSGWAARKPVVATHEVAAGICRHERDAVLVYANTGSLVWGIERVLYDPELGPG